MRGNERTRHIPLIFVTAGAADGQRRFRGYEAGAVAFVQKPIETDILRSKADVFFQLYRQRQQIAAQRDELEAQAEALKEAGRRKDEFLLTLTHDLTLHKDARAQQDVLLREINHRIKNLFTLTSGLISLSARNARSVEDLSSNLRSRLKALADAHDLTLPDLRKGQLAGSSTTVAALMKAILAPHEFEHTPRITVAGSDAALAGSALTSFALLIHELTTNAAKYGALSTPEGRLAVAISVTTDETLRVDWQEQTVAPPIGDREREGFGTALEKAVLAGLEGSISRDWRDGGLSLTIEMPLARLVS